MRAPASLDRSARISSCDWFGWFVTDDAVAHVPADCCRGKIPKKIINWAASVGFPAGMADLARAAATLPPPPPPPPPPCG